MLLAVSLVFTGCGQRASESASETKAGKTDPLSSQPSVSETAPAAQPKFAAREGLETVLFMGLDKYEAPENEMGYLNDQQSDFLLLLILDEKNETVDVLHLNRDTMTEIRRLGVGGGDAGKFIGQLTLAHTYGSGGSDSCLNSVKAVSKLLKGIHIDHYVAMTMAGVGKLNDLVGGVEVTIPVDMTIEDPSFVAGATLTLHGQQALKFVRARGGLEDSSNLSRMERQRQYLTGLYSKLMEAVRSDSEFSTRSLLDMTSYFQSDLTVNQLSDLFDRVKDYALKPFETLPGEARMGEKYIEFYVDEEGLNALMEKLFG